MLHNLMSVGRLGDRFFQFELCDAWNQVQGNASIYPRRSRYAGDFEMHNGTLRTPVLLLSNTVDPVTPLHSAKTVLARLGDNARLVQQAGGVGHCTIAHASRCTAAKVRAYFLEGQVPDEMHGYCEVDQKAFEPLGWNDMEIPDGKWLQA
jgi:pimeloyl-ACP methyl ester carboxylesterase